MKSRLNVAQIKITLPLALCFLLSACSSEPKLNKEMVEKYPQCYHMNVKISNKCIEKNEAGEKTTAVELENTAYPGQYN